MDIESLMPIGHKFSRPIGIKHPIISAAMTLVTSAEFVDKVDLNSLEVC